MRIEEKQLILPTLYIIQRDGPTSTSKLIEELTAVFHPTGEDAKILAGRRDTKFSQKVRNLKSHRDSNSMDIYTDIDGSGRYVLTKAGAKYLKAHFKAVDYLFSNRFKYGDAGELASKIRKSGSKKHKLRIYSEEDMISEGASVCHETKTRRRSRRLREAAIEHYRGDDGKIRCAVCGFCFEEHYGKTGKDFIEIHHKRPIYQYDEDGFEELIPEAVLNVRPLCANCHRMIHRDPKRPLSIKELRARYVK